MVLNLTLVVLHIQLSYDHLCSRKIEISKDLLGFSQYFVTLFSQLIFLTFVTGLAN